MRIWNRVNYKILTIGITAGVLSYVFGFFTPLWSLALMLSHLSVACFGIFIFHRVEKLSADRRIVKE